LLNLVTVGAATGETLMSTLKVELEDEVVELLRQSDRSPEAAAREMIVMDLYRRGVISEGRASELLAMPRLEFVQRASQLDIPHFQFTEDDWQNEVTESDRI
jgi:predicted HTH domain antitoxin